MMKNRSQKIFRIILISLGLIFLFITQFQLSSIKDNIKEGIVIKGRIKNIKKSRNHSFGIVSFTIDSTNYIVDSFLIYKEGMPFRIEQQEAEVYGTIGIKDSLANVILLNSSERKFYLLKGKEVISIGNLHWIHDKSDVKFIGENSKFTNAK